MRTGELEQNIGEGNRIDFSAALKLCRTFRRAEGEEIFLLRLVAGEFGESFIKALWRSAKDVHVLEKRLVHGAILQNARVLASRDLDDFIGVQSVPLGE